MRSRFLARRKRHSGVIEPLELSQFIRQDLAATRHPIGDPQRLPLSDIVPLIFKYAKAPLTLNEIVTLVAALWGAKEDEQVEIDARNLDLLEPELAQQPKLASAYEDRQILRQVWKEIGRLPKPQQKALLLGMHTHQGRDALALLIHTGVATPEQLALLLEMSISDLEELSGTLPLKDSELAARLGVTRQQVINLRVSARKRLGRRLKAINKEHQANPRGNHLTMKAS